MAKNVLHELQFGTLCSYIICSKYLWDWW